MTTTNANQNIPAVVKMSRSSILCLLFVATAHAAITLTLCPADLSLPCLNDTTTGKTTNLQPGSNQSYNFSNLNISVIQDLPADAKYVDLPYNQISQVSRGIPASVTFLNLSHNTLQSNWIQTPLPMTTLDVSYNQGGLHWIQNVKWGESLTKLTRLIYRGNNLRNLKWGYDNFPAGQHPFSAMDLNGNPQLTIRMELITFAFMQNRFTLTADATSYNATLRICENHKEYIVQFAPWNILHKATRNTTKQSVHKQCMSAVGDIMIRCAHRRQLQKTMESLEPPC
ncbi:hypothetical protein AC1031_011260 [Aphanomyces cochlioides]|nr:hypothetical protein AC1031_011260 [Aphanomyces cochlioides]